MSTEKPKLILSVVKDKWRFRIGVFLTFTMLPLWIGSMLFLESTMISTVLGLFMFTGFILLSIKTFNISGKVIFYNDSIKVENKESSEFISYGEINSLLIEINEIEGEKRYVFNPVTVHEKEGTLNYVSFRVDGKTSKLQILLKNNNVKQLNSALVFLNEVFDKKLKVQYKGKEVEKIPSLSR